MELLKEISFHFSTREIAIFIWLLIVLPLLLLKKNIRLATTHLIKSFFSWKIQVTLLIALAYSSVPILIFLSIDVWDISLLKDFIYWFCGFAFITMMELVNKAKDEGRFKRILAEEFKLIVIIQFIAAYHQYSLKNELILVPVLFMLSYFSVRYKSAQKFFTGILVFIGVYLFIISVIVIVRDVNDFANQDTLKSFLQPIILSVWFIPFAYFMTVYLRYENIFKRLGMFMKDTKLKNFTKRRILWKGKLNIKKINKLSSAINWLYDKSTREDVIKHIN